MGRIGDQTETGRGKGRRWSASPPSSGRGPEIAEGIRSRKTAGGS